MVYSKKYLILLNYIFPNFQLIGYYLILYVNFICDLLTLIKYIICLRFTYFINFFHFLYVPNVISNVYYYLIYQYHKNYCSIH